MITRPRYKLTTSVRSALSKSVPPITSHLERGVGDLGERMKDVLAADLALIGAFERMIAEQEDAGAPGSTALGEDLLRSVRHLQEHS
jgi:hypothetical protein